MVSDPFRRRWPGCGPAAAALGQRTLRAPSRTSRRARSSGPRCRAARGARRAGRRSGRRGAGCARTRRSERNASGQKFADLSRAANGRSPIMWQIELTDQVTWCSTAMRTRPAQKKRSARRSRTGDQPADHGRARSIETIVQTQKYLSMPGDRPCRPAGRGRSAAGWWCRGRRSSPCGRARSPWTSAATEVPYSHGECGSPSRSEKAWCRRWSATQMITGPCTAIWPAIGQDDFRSGRLALNDAVGEVAGGSRR